MDKTKGVMTALKGRKNFTSKNGSPLLGLVQKLTAKRKALAVNEEGPAHEKTESVKKEKGEAGK